MLIDPRPYTYQYRKPRFSNPTYQSSGLYGSLYHTRLHANNDYFPSSRSNSQHIPPSMTNSMPVPPRNSSQPRYTPPSRHQEDIPMPQPPPVTQNPEGPNSVKLPSIKQQRYALPQSVSSSSMGSSGLGKQSEISRRQGFERFRIYENQQKPFNIISCYPKEDESNFLRSYPKLTLEDRLREHGVYHRL